MLQYPSIGIIICIFFLLRHKQSTFMRLQSLEEDEGFLLFHFTDEENEPEVKLFSENYCEFTVTMKEQSQVKMCL